MHSGRPRRFHQTWSQHPKPESITRKKLNISKTSTRHYLDQNNIRTFATISPTFFNRTSSRLPKPEVIPAKRTNNYRKSTARPFDQNNTGIFTPIVPLLFNQILSDAKESERNRIYQTHQLMNSSILRNTVQQDGYPPGIGGAVQIATQSQLVVTNCVFEDNSAQLVGGAVTAVLNVTLDIQGTTFVGNKAVQGGVFDVQHQVHLRITNCTFIDNHAEQNSGAISEGYDSVLEIQRTNFHR